MKSAEQKKTEAREAAKYSKARFLEQEKRFKFYSAQSEKTNKQKPLEKLS